jgi:two-component system chemotaxis response regulator CheB
MAILLTGIGQDGALGLKALFEAGAKCYGENEESAVVYGMPKQAKEINPELKMLSLLEIKSVLQRFC